MTKRIGHIYKTLDLARAVLDGVPISAVCGSVRSFVPSDFDGSWGDRSCSECLSALGKVQGEDAVNFRPPMTYVQLLEEFARIMREPKGQTVRITASGTPRRWDFPLAG